MRERDRQGGSPGYALIIRGPLGVGKSTVARSLASALRAQVISIDALTDRAWDGGSLGLYLRANRAALRQAHRALGAGRPVVFDGCFYWKTQLRDLERRLTVPVRVFTLHASPELCIARDAQRAVPHGAHAARAVHRKVGRVRWGTSVDTSRAVPQIVREIRSLLRKDTSVYGLMTTARVSRPGSKGRIIMSVRPRKRRSPGTKKLNRKARQRRVAARRRQVPLGGNRRGA